MKRTYLLIAMLLACALGCASIKSIFERDDEKEIALSDVPVEAVQAAQAAVVGITLTEASVEEEDGKTIYDLEGTADGTEYEIEVTADGEVLEVEKEGQDTDDDDDHDEAEQEDDD
ncbi:MAG: hypothetical protein JSW27_15595 [Phycisphaerales bacterium]|nr:MAG: hypothetical protein JSW27_15595 [Phycisphaerales bacterium]